MTRYQRARADFEYLETIALLEDQVELDAEREPLMQNPTKEKAADLYEAGIRLWFSEHPNLNDKRIAKIADRYL